jgi:hypothetical protein
MDAIVHERKSPGILALVLIVGALASLAASQATAQTETKLPAVQSGLMGIARAQTARLTVIHLPPSDPEYPPNPCMATLMFLDEQGETYQDRAGSPVAARAEIRPGESAFLELRAADALVGSTAMRRQFRVAIERRSGPIEHPPNPCDGLVPTLEVYDTFTGRTTIFHDLRSAPVQPPASGQ